MDRFLRVWALVALAGMCAGAQDACEQGAEAARQRDFARAQTLLERCRGERPSLESLLLLAAVYQAGKQTEALYDLALEGMQRFPAEPRFYLAVAGEDGRAGRFAHAIEVLNQALLRWPVEPKLQSLLANAHFGEGRALLNAEKAEAALPHLRKAVKLEPADVEAQLNLGRALHNSHQRVEALEIFEALSKRTPAVL
ncbi:MAG: tetratricopeptide repeat protein [Bryobacterales bacterium]|nr:tetratricopeptide repeat protein [Bryobacterales bacterium]